MTGRLPEQIPLYRGHTAQVLDTDFSPSNDKLIASASEDATIMLWQVNPDIAPIGDEEVKDFSPLAKLTGHNRKVGHVLFHPTAENVLASSSGDYCVKIWDVEKAAERLELSGFKEVVQSMAWSYEGNLLASTCRDKRLRIFDVRSKTIVSEGPGHDSFKASRVVWLGDSGRIITTGSSKMSERQIKLWDPRNVSQPIKSQTIDTSAGTLMPFYDADTAMLYVAGKGDGNIRYYELQNDELHYVNEYKSTEPQRGMAMMPKRGVNVFSCEIDRLYKLSGSGYVEPISFIVPRKSEAFQSDIFPPTASGNPSLTADEYFGGKTGEPKLVNLDNGAPAAKEPVKDKEFKVQKETEAVAETRPSTTAPLKEVKVAPPTTSAPLVDSDKAITAAVSSSTPAVASPNGVVKTAAAENNNGAEVAQLKQENEALQAKVKELEAQLEEMRLRAEKAEAAAAQAKESSLAAKEEVTPVSPTRDETGEEFKVPGVASASSQDVRLVKADETVPGVVVSGSGGSV